MILHACSGNTCWRYYHILHILVTLVGDTTRFYMFWSHLLGILSDFTYFGNTCWRYYQILHILVTLVGDTIGFYIFW